MTRECVHKTTAVVQGHVAVAYTQYCHTALPPKTSPPSVQSMDGFALLHSVETATASATASAWHSSSQSVHAQPCARIVLLLSS